jgi:flagellar biosynthesis/type III secretory pathway protein FliH
MLAATFFFLVGSAAAQSQSRPSTPLPSPEPIPTNPNKPDSSTDFGSPESEMRARLILKAEKKQYDENVARAREAAQLATHLVETYEAKKAFGSDDGKKLERLEKLTKRIRNEAGGSDTEPDIKDIPAAMETAVKRVAELANDLRKLVEDTPRHVISASVIDQANKLLGLIQHVRDAR